MLPPRWVRRVVLAPAVVALTLLLVSVLPGLLVLALVLSPLLPGRWRPLRFGWLVLLHLVLETTALLAMFALWVGSGFGYALRRPWFRRAHYRIVSAYLALLFSEAERVLNVTVKVSGPLPSDYHGRPLIVFSRHAGPGDSFLVTHALVNWYDREPRIVLKDTMQWDPMIDVVLNRLPNRFISLRPGAGGAGVEHDIGVLATGLDEDDAFVIFPEGGNFTERRRARTIERLRDKGLIAEAEMAERMRHVLAPRPGGVVAALTHAPEADVVWVAHTGTDTMYSVADVWRAMPMDTEVEMRWWQVPRDEVPRTREEQVAWLYEWWARIDAWIEERRTPSAVAEKRRAT
jgi:1-acyl-sn-glycerol-3-phosphate acyltransferase